MFAQRKISGSSKPLWSEDELGWRDQERPQWGVSPEQRNIERRRWQVGQGYQAQDSQALLGRGKDQGRPGRAAGRREHRCAVLNFNADVRTEAMDTIKVDDPDHRLSGQVSLSAIKANSMRSEERTRPPSSCHHASKRRSDRERKRHMKEVSPQPHPATVLKTE